MIKPEETDSNLIERLYVLSCAIKPERMKFDIKPVFFKNDAYKSIYTRILEFKRDGKDFDLSILYLSFSASSKEREILSIDTDIISDELIDTYAEKLREAFRNRIAQETLNEIFLEEGHHNPYKFQLKLNEKLALIAPEDSVNDSKKIVKNIANFFDTQSSLNGKINGVTSGFKSFDAYFNGFQPSKLYVLAARPSMGKSTMLMNFAVNAAKTKKSVYVHCLEESLNSFSCRMIAYLSGLNSEQIQRGLITEWPMVTDALNEIANFNFYINEKSNATAAEVCESIRAQNFKSKIDIVFIDHIQDLKLTKDSWHHGISEACALFKGLAKDLKIPVIVVSQLSRAVEQRTDKHPMLSDLKESGDIEQKADAVIFIYRDDYYNQSALPGACDISIAKNRDGRVGMFNMFFNANCMKFSD